jgi:hypothetical protein
MILCNQRMLESTMNKQKVKPSAPTKARLLRAIASSTAIETGQSINMLELKLKQPNPKFKSLELA